jgi:hypothetical protein
MSIYISPQESRGFYNEINRIILIEKVLGAFRKKLDHTSLRLKMGWKKVTIK